MVSMMVSPVPPVRQAAPVKPARFGSTTPPTLDASNYETSLRATLNPTSWQALQILDAVSRLEDLAKLAPEGAEPKRGVHFPNALFDQHMSPKRPADLLHGQLSALFADTIPSFAPIHNTVTGLFGNPPATRPDRDGLDRFRNEGLKPVFESPPTFDTSA